MAKQIKNSDLVQGNLWNDTIKETNALVTVLEKLEKSFKDVSKASSEAAKKADPGSAKGQKVINEDLEKQKRIKSDLTKIDKQREAAEGRLRIAQSKQGKELERTNQRLLRQKQANRSLAKETDTLNGAYGRSSAKLTRLTKKYKDLEFQNKGNTREAKRLLRQITFLDGKLKKVDKSVGQSQRNVGNYSSAFKGLGKGLGKLGGILGFTAVGIAGVVAGVRAAIPLFREFGLVSAKVKAVSGATAEEFEVLQTQAMELGRVTPFTASNVAELQLELSKLGLTAKEIGDSTEGILNFGIATDSALGEAGKTVASTINAFELLASDSGKVADVLTKAFSSSALNLEKFDTALGIVGATANLAGLSLEETTAILGTLVDAGVDASKAATGLRKVLAISANENRNYKDVLAEIVGDTNQLSKANELFGLTAQSQAALIAKNIDKVDGLTLSLQNAGGASKEAADIIGDTLDGDIKRLTSAIQGATLENKGFEDVLRDIIQFLTEAVPPVFNFLVNLFKVLLPLMKPVLIAFEVLADGIRGVTDAIGLSTKEIDSFIKATEDAKQANEDFENQLQSEFQTLKSLKDRITDVNTSQEERAALIKLVNTEYADYLPSLISEEDSLERIEEKLNDATSAMIKRLILMKEEERIAEALAKQIEDRTENLKFQKEAQNALNKLVKEQILLEELRVAFLAENTKEVEKLSKALDIFVGAGVGLQNITDRISGLESNLVAAKAAVEGVNNAIEQSGEFNAIKAITDSIDDLLASFGLIRDELKKDDEDEPDKGGKGGKELTQADILAAAKLSIEEQFQRDKLQLLIDADSDISKEKNKIFTTDVQKQKEINKIKKALDENLNDLDIERLQKLTDKRFEILKKDDAENIKLKQDLQKKLTKLETDGIEERSEEQKKALEAHNKELEALKDEHQKALDAKSKKIQDSTVAAIDVLDQAFAKASDNRINEIDREIQALQSREDALRQAAQNGSELAKDNLATNQRLQAEQERAREEQVKKAQRREIVLAGIKAFAENAGQPNAVGKTLTDITTLSAALLNLLPGFHDGTDDTGNSGSLSDKHGVITGYTHKNEMVLSEDDRGDIGFDKTRGDIKDAFAFQEMHQFQQAPIVQVQRFESNEAILNKFDELKQELINMPKNMPRLVSENFDEKSKVYTTIIKTRNKVEKNHKKIGGAGG